MGEGYTLGALVQANHGERRHLRVLGTPVGERLTGNMPGEGVRSETGQGPGSIIMVLATDAPLLPHQLQRLARRGAMGLARTGAIAGSGSGDFCIALSTAHAVQPATTIKLQVEALSDGLINPVFEAGVESVEEAILNALLQAGTMQGRDNRLVHALDPDALLAAMKNR
jgi:D-aminopeptidase